MHEMSLETDPISRADKDTCLPPQGAAHRWEQTL